MADMTMKATMSTVLASAEILIATFVFAPHFCNGGAASYCDPETFGIVMTTVVAQALACGLVLMIMASDRRPAQIATLLDDDRA